jgi:hypothetical protein
MNPLETHNDYCPYCGEPIELVIDASGGDQSYIEDCAVCCRPISVELRCDEDEISVQLFGENE